MPHEFEKKQSNFKLISDYGAITIEYYMHGAHKSANNLPMRKNSALDKKKMNNQNTCTFVVCTF